MKLLAGAQFRAIHYATFLAQNVNIKATSCPRHARAGFFAASTSKSFGSSLFHRRFHGALPTRQMCEHRCLKPPRPSTAKSAKQLERGQTPKTRNGAICYRSFRSPFSFLNNSKR